MICGKVIYPDIRAAVDAIKGLMSDDKTKRSNKQASRAYFCDECQGYHLHTENKKQTVRNKKAQRRKQEADSEHPKAKQRKSDSKTLIIHDRLKFKVK